MQDGTYIDENGAQALNLYEETVNSMGAEDPPRVGSVSTIAWIGYDSPNFNPESMPWGLPESVGDVAHTVTEANAQDGGIRLSQFVDGLNSTHESGNQPHLTVIGHSYGSTTAAHAATDGLDADRLVLIGSPGAGGGTENVGQLNMPDGTVYVGSAENDPVTWLGRDDDEESRFFGSIPLNPFAGDGGLGLGEDPSQSSFGAQRFSVDDGTVLHANNIYADGLMGNHTSYLDEGSTSLSNIGRIVQGDEPTIVAGREKDANDYLTDWGRGEALHQSHQAYQDYIQRPIIDPVVHTYETGRDVVEGAVNTGREAVEGAVDAGHRVVDGAVDTGRDAVRGVGHVVSDPIGSFKDVFGR